MEEDTHREQVADAHREADGQRRRSLQVVAFGVTGGKHGEDELEGDEELHSQAAPGGNPAIDLLKHGDWLLHDNNRVLTLTSILED